MFDCRGDLGNRCLLWADTTDWSNLLVFLLFQHELSYASRIWAKSKSNSISETQCMTCSPLWWQALWTCKLCEPVPEWAQKLKCFTECALVFWFRSPKFEVNMKQQVDLISKRSRSSSPSKASWHMPVVMLLFLI